MFDGFCYESIKIRCCVGFSIHILALPAITIPVHVGMIVQHCQLKIHVPSAHNFFKILVTR